MITKNNRERGQVMVLLAIGFVVLLGFVALAIDGGMVYSERRHAQNGSDASSLAGGGAAALSLENSFMDYAHWNCADGRMTNAINAAIAAAISRAGNNNFTIDNNIADKHGVIAVCGTDSSYGYVDKFLDVTVQISDTVKTNFLQVFYGGKMRNQVQAITRVRPRSPIAFGHAVVGLNNADCQGNQNGTVFGGSSEVDINGGGVWSNGCLQGVGNAYDVDVTNGAINYVHDLEGQHLHFDPEQTQVPYELPPSSYELAAPNCADPNAHHMNNLTLHNGTLNLDPGLYCISGDITINGGTIVGHGVTFYLSSGDVTINGNAEVDLSSPAVSPDPSPAVGGLLFYVATGDINLEGNASSAYLGLIYAPQGDIDISGANGTTPTFNTQIVGWNVHVSGNADIDINFNAGEEYSRPTSIELWK